MQRLKFIGMLWCIWLFSSISVSYADTNILIIIEKQVLELGEWTFNVAWNSNGELLAISAESGVHLYDANLKSVAFLDSRIDVSDFAFTLDWCSDGRRLAMGTSDGQIHVWDVVEKNKLFAWQAHISFPVDISWSHDCEQILSGAWNRGISLYDVDNHISIPLPAFAESFSAYAVEWHPNDRYFLALSIDIIGWDIITDKSLFEIEAIPASTARWRPDGEMFAVSEYVPTYFDEDGKIIPEGDTFWALKFYDDEGILLHTLYINAQRDMTNPHVGIIGALAWHPTQPWIAGAAYDHKIRIWDVNTWEKIAEIPAEKKWVSADAAPANMIAWSPDGRFLADAGKDGTVRIWEVEYE